MPAIPAADLTVLEQLAREEPGIFAAMLAVVRAFLRERAAA